MAFATISPSAARFAERAAPVAPAETGGVTCRAISPPSRNATSKASCPGLNAARATRGALPGGKGEPVGPGRDPLQGAGQGDDCRRQARRAGEIQARAASVRRLRPAEGAGGNEHAAQARRQFPLALLRPVLRRPRAKLLYVPAAHSERHSETLAVRGAGRPDRALRRAVFARHDARESADPRDPAEARRRSRRRHREPRPVVARLRRRQHPQRHRHAHRRHRSARRLSTRARMRASGTSTSSTTARFTACRASSMSASTAAASFRCWRTPTTSAFRRSR